MEKRSTQHARFDIERFYDASPARVFGAFADPAAKAEWFGPTDSAKLTLDFQVGGREHFTEEMPNGMRADAPGAVHRSVRGDRRGSRQTDVHGHGLRHGPRVGSDLQIRPLGLPHDAARSPQADRERTRGLGDCRSVGED